MTMTLVRITFPMAMSLTRLLKYARKISLKYLSYKNHSQVSKSFYNNHDKPYINKQDKLLEPSKTFFKQT